MIGTAARAKWTVDRRFNSIAFLPGVGGLIREGRGGGPPALQKSTSNLPNSLATRCTSAVASRDRDVGGERRILASVDRDLRPFAGERVGDGAANAPRPTAHQRDATLEAEVHARSMRTAQIFSSAIFA